MIFVVKRYRCDLQKKSIYFDFNQFKRYFRIPKKSILNFKPHSHCDDVATVHPDAGQPVYRDAPGHIS